MNEMVKLNANLPAHLQGVKVENVFQSAASEGGFPVISLKGKDFTIVRSGEKEIITNEHGDSVRSFEAVIVSVNPKKLLQSRWDQTSGGCRERSVQNMRSLSAQHLGLRNQERPEAQSV
jgi:hypothetical protein